MSRLFPYPLLFLAPALLLVGCDGGDDVDDSDTDAATTDTDGDDTDVDDTDDTDVAPSALAILGTWFDNWGDAHVITDTVWTSGTSTYAISTYDNDSTFLVAQNGPDNTYNPDKWSRFDWAWDADGELMFCQTAFDADTEADALATPAADPSSPTGCAGFPWNTLRATFTLAGAWDDNWGDEHAIDPFAWTSGSSTYAVSQVDDDASWLVAQNGSDNPYNPDKWSRFDWTWDDDGRLRFCQTAYNAASEAAAIATPRANEADLAAGCGTFPWNELRASLSIGGAWIDNWESEHVIDAFTWSSGSSVYAITEADDTAHWLVAQNDENNPYNPGLWSRFDWTWDAEGDLWFCQTVYDGATEAAARGAPAADATSPSTGGCGPFAWSSLTVEAP